MNGQSICREPIEGGRKCGRHYGHGGTHQCCQLHTPQQPLERMPYREDER